MHCSGYVQCTVVEVDSDGVQGTAVDSGGEQLMLWRCAVYDSEGVKLTTVEGCSVLLWRCAKYCGGVIQFTAVEVCRNRVILILDLVSPGCSTCSQTITNTHAIPKSPDLDRWVEF